MLFVLSTIFRELTLAPWLCLYVCVWAVGLLPDVQQMIQEGSSFGEDPERNDYY
uniref:Uncharacterized protein n=1 Tax=Lotus japonicus TaxID=34305 RepID=I3SLX9_LOTJA|nr:unknown [Lotus japonicus]